jgi:hypothetical protein
MNEEYRALKRRRIGTGKVLNMKIKYVNAVDNIRNINKSGIWLIVFYISVATKYKLRPRLVFDYREGKGFFLFLILE